MEGTDAAGAFWKLASEPRVDIIRAVADAARDTDAAETSRPVAFAELQRRVGIQDSGRFNYHLKQLTGTFLRKTDDGYAFTYAGERVARTVLSGAYGDEVEFDAVTLDGPCPSCGGPLSLCAEPVEFVVRCGDCGQSAARHPSSPSMVAGRDPDAVVDVVAERLRAAMRAAVGGVCADCGGVLDGEVRSASVPGDPYLYVATCRECWAPYRLPLALWVFDHPATVSFFWARGVDVTALPFWELLAHLADGRWRVAPLSGDRAYEVTVREGGDELRFELDDDLAVEAVERTTG